MPKGEKMGLKWVDLRKRTNSLLNFAAAGFVLWAAAAHGGSLSAGACPTCFGFEQIGNNIYLEKGANASQIQNALNYEKTAISDVRKFFPDFKAGQRTLVCYSLKCEENLGITKAKANTYRTWLVVVSSRGFEQTFFTHEYSHVALHEISGIGLNPMGIFPVWFDEGLAVIISKDKRYINPDKTGLERCIDKDIKNVPNLQTQWGAYVSKDLMVYSRSACRVSLWLEKYGEPPEFYKTIKSMIAVRDFKE